MKQIGILLDRPCGLCRSTAAVIAESRAVRHGLAWVNPVWKAEPELYEVCSGCGARRPLEDQRLAS
jgi:hypothetical protein